MIQIVLEDGEEVTKRAQRAWDRSMQSKPECEQRCERGNPEKEATLRAWGGATGIRRVQVNRQRKDGGATPRLGGKPDPAGSEVFIGRLPQDVYEHQLIPLFQRVGLQEFRLMMTFSGLNRGFAYASYSSRHRAQAAIATRHDHLQRPSIPSGNPLYESYYKQVDPAYTGRVGASEAALFLKKSGLSDIILGKIWDLADPEGKGFLDKQGFYVALRLVACAQSGHEVTLSNLSLSMPPPKFHDTSSPLMVTPPSAEAPWAVRVEEKAKFDGIFESLLPINGLLSGDKVKPVLMNSKLPLDVLGRVWDLSDIDKDGQLDRDEFAVAMHLVYRALEKEPVPSVLPPSLIPPSKRKKTVFPGAVPVLPASPPPKDSLRSTPSHGSVSSLNSTGSLSPKHSIKQTQPTVTWVVPVADKMRFDEIFLKTDLDLDGYVSGQEVKEIFMHSGLTQNLLAHIWALADTRQTGKLSKDQFALAMYFIQQKVSKGIDPPQVLSPDMVPPSERGTPIPDSSSSLGSGEFTGVKELDDISQEIAQLQREKYSLEQDIREKEEAIRQKTNEVQELQNDLDRETSSLQELEAQKQDAQDRLDEMDQQKAKLRDMLSDVRQKCQDETQMISSLKTQIQSQESDLKSQEDDLNRAKSELNRLQQEETQLEQSIQAGRVQLETIIKSLKSTQDEINQARSKLSQLHESRLDAHRSLEQQEQALGGARGASLTDLATLSDGVSLAERGSFGAMDDPFKNKTLLFSNNTQELHPDPFQAEDPFKSDPFKGADPFKGQVCSIFPLCPRALWVTSGMHAYCRQYPGIHRTHVPRQDDPFKNKTLLFSNNTQELHPDPFQAEDPFKSDPFKGADPFKGDPFQNDPFAEQQTASTDPFGGDPFKESDPFRGSTTDDFFKKQTKNDPFTSDPFTKNPSLPSKLDPFESSDPFSSSSVSSKGSDPFGTLDPFGSGSFNSAEGFADFSQMSQPPTSGPFTSSLGGAGFSDDPFKSKQDTPALPPKKPAPPRPKPPSGKSTPVSQLGSADFPEPPDPFQPLGADSGDPFQNKKGFGDPFSGKDPFVPSSSAKPSKASSSGFADFTSFGNEEQQLAWAKRESEKAEQERLARLRRQEQEDLELAIALSKADMPAA
ncbi:Epidermal growth factor receptor substrate 15-like 1 [Sciurus carolinensis]|uniref:Epidermal growth factor receptor substrate 15-like 1 n=1 Tax=Sciurus carolinensis TaxID=30640 RepID=A0AA41MI63_SCICA|nr:Epidermal growth factor receptor substrate 15-like 1 [Sciurus carolinensis]